MGWKEWLGDKGVALGIDHYGASAPYQEIYQHFGLTVDHIIQTVERMIAK